MLGDDGRLSWIMDAFTVSDSYPYSTHYRLNETSINYMRNSVKVVIDAYDGTTTFYVFDPEQTPSRILSKDHIHRGLSFGFERKLPFARSPNQKPATASVT